ncbi:MAG: hypothetical protein ACM32E_25545 [Gemmatimonadota bacterium]
MSAGERLAERAAAGRGTRQRPGWRAVAGAGAGASLALGLLLAVCTFIAVAMPRASLGYRSAALHHVLASLPASEKVVLGGADLGPGEGYFTPPALGVARSRLSAGLAASGLPLAAGRQQWAGLAAGPGLLAGRFSLPPDIGAAEIELLYRSSLAANAHLVAGRYPAAVTPLPGSSARFQVAVTEATARTLRIHVGSRLRTSGQVLEVTGIIGPVRPGSTFWALQPDASSPRLVYPTTDSAPYLDVAAFVGPGEVAGLESVRGEPARALWSFPLDLSAVSAGQAASLAAALGRITDLPVLSSLASGSGALPGPAGGPLLVSLSTGMVTPLSSFVAEDQAVQAALSLLMVSLGVVAALVVLLGARLVTGYRSAELALMRARGASLARLAAVVLAGCSLAVVPAAALAAGAAVAATPGSASGLSWWLGGLIVATALAGPPLLAAWAHRPRRRAAARRVPSGPVRRRAAAARRLLLSATLVCASVAGLVVLRLQGPAGPGTTDLFTSAAPVLTAIPVALLAMALLPVVTRWLLRLAARRRGVVAVLGLARGSAAPGGVLPVFALILALALIAFAAMERGAVARGNVAASWQRAGADAVVTVPATGSGITARARRLLARVPGARHTAELAVAGGTSDEELPLAVVVVDPARYAALTRGTPARFPGGALRRPALPAGAPGPVPVLVSPAARGLFSTPARLAAGGRDLPIRFAGQVASMPLAPAGTPFAVVPRWALGNAAPAATAIAITGPRLDTAAVAAAARRALPGSQVTLRSRVLAAISAEPLPHGGQVILAQGGLAAAGMMLLVLLLTLVLGARSRERTLARMVTMGLAAGQWRRIVLVETLPPVIAAITGGTVCALVLVPLVGPAIHLAAFTGLPVTVPLHADPVVLAGAAGGLLALAVLATAGQDWLARRRGAGRVLRLGD